MESDGGSAILKLSLLYRRGKDIVASCLFRREFQWLSKVYSWKKASSNFKNWVAFYYVFHTAVSGIWPTGFRGSKKSGGLAFYSYVTQITVDGPVRVGMEIIEILSKMTGSHRKKPERLKQKQGHTKVLWKAVWIETLVELTYTSSQKKVLNRNKGRTKNVRLLFIISLTQPLHCDWLSASQLIVISYSHCNAN